MRCLDAGGRAFWQLVGVAVAALTVAGLIAACLPTALRLWLAGTAQPGLLLGGTVLTVVAGAILGVAVRALRRTSRATRVLRRELSARRGLASGTLLEVAAEVGLAGVEVITDPEPFALTYGVRRPRVAVSTGLVEALSREELAAVLAHEQAHVECRDPLRVLLAAGASVPGFWLPVLPALRTRFVIGRELAADRRAMARYGKRALAGALLKAVEVPAGATGMAEALAFDARLVQLETGSEAGLPRVGTLRVVLSVLGIVTLACGAVLTSALMAAAGG